MDPQLTVEPRDEGSGGLALVRDIVVAPGRAFRTIDRSPQWIPAYVVATVCTLIALVLYAPALTNVMLAIVASDAQTRGQSLAEMHQTVNLQLADKALDLTIGPLIVWGITAFALSTTAMLCGKPARLGTYFSLAANCAVPGALGTLAAALILRAHDPTTYHTIRDIDLAFPSLANLNPGGNDSELAFLAYWDVFAAWSIVLIGLGFSAIAKISSLGALAVSAGIALVFALLAAIIAS